MRFMISSLRARLHPARIVALATLAAALLHGPALAALGGSAHSSHRCSLRATAELLGALHLPCRRHRCLVLPRPRAHVALARHHGGRVRHAVDVPGIADTRVDSLTLTRLQPSSGFILAALLIVSGLF